jgi:hypothetical protein
MCQLMEPPLRSWPRPRPPGPKTSKFDSGKERRMTKTFSLRSGVTAGSFSHVRSVTRSPSSTMTQCLVASLGAEMRRRLCLWESAQSQPATRTIGRTKTPRRRKRRVRPQKRRKKKAKKRKKKNLSPTWMRSTST